jgi:predicted nuclease with TOPRIM domain
MANEVDELQARIDDLEAEVKELESELRQLEAERDDLSDQVDELESEVDALEFALREQPAIEITQHHIITLREAIENYGGTNSQRAMLTDVMRLVEAC